MPPQRLIEGVEPGPLDPLHLLGLQELQEHVVSQGLEAGDVLVVLPRGRPQDLVNVRNLLLLHDLHQRAGVGVVHDAAVLVPDLLGEVAGGLDPLDPGAEPDGDGGELVPQTD